MQQDEELVTRAKRGDEAALEVLLRRYEVRITSFLYRMLGDAHAAEDAAQETLIRAIRGLARYRERGRFKSWLFQIAHREGLRALRKRRRTSEFFGSEEVLERLERAEDAGPRPDEAAREREDRAAMEKAIQALPPAEKEVVLLRLEGGLTFREIADVMRCPLGTALGRMRNAASRLRTDLS